MAELNLMDRYPRSKRPIDDRAKLITPEHRAIARRFERDFFDGDRLCGYGGYNYHPRFWTETVKRFRDHYQLADDAHILDVGCGKGFMLHDFKLLLPRATVAGVDISRYAIENAKEEMRPYLKVGDARELPYPSKSFDLVISINTVHNFERDDLKRSLREITRVSRRHAFVVVDAWRNDDERERLLKWNLTALTYMHVDDWKKFLAEAGYAGDAWWFIAE